MAALGTGSVAQTDAGALLAGLASGSVVTSEQLLNATVLPGVQRGHVLVHVHVAPIAGAAVATRLAWSGRFLRQHVTGGDPEAAAARASVPVVVPWGSGGSATNALSDSCEAPVLLSTVPLRSARSGCDVVFEITLPLEISAASEALHLLTQAAEDSLAVCATPGLAPAVAPAFVVLLEPIASPIRSEASAVDTSAISIAVHLQQLLDAAYEPQRCDAVPAVALLARADIGSVSQRAALTAIGGLLDGADAARVAELLDAGVIAHLVRTLRPGGSEAAEGQIAGNLRGYSASANTASSNAASAWQMAAHALAAIAASSPEHRDTVLAAGALAPLVALADTGIASPGVPAAVQAIAALMSGAHALDGDSLMAVLHLLARMLQLPDSGEVPDCAPSALDAVEALLRPSSSLAPERAAQAERCRDAM